MHHKHPLQPPPPLLRHRLSSSESQVCASFNAGRCSRQRCRFMHVCNFCGGAHARIICPVSKAANKNSKRYLTTPVNTFRLSSELVHHPDPHFTKYLLSGLSHGFHPGVGNLPSESLICPNLQSALTEPETVDILIKKEIEANFMIGPFPAPPFNIFRVSPIGVATRKFSGKKRLIIDLSSPHNSPFPSINSLIPLEEFSLHYHDIDQAITLIKDPDTPHPSTSLFRTDIPINHPLKPLLEASLNSILQAVSPRTLQSYLTAWKSFKTFHSTYNLPFPAFSLLAITSFISHLNINKKLQISSIKGYLSGLQFFADYKLLYGSPSAHIANSQTSLLIKGIQKTNPTRP